MESVGLLTGMIVKVGLGVLLALGATGAARYLHVLRYGRRPRNGMLEVVETAALGQNRAVHLITVGRRTLLIAATPGRIATLADVTGEVDPEPASAGGASCGLRGLRHGFASALAQALGAPAQPQEGEGQAERLRAAARALRTNDASGSGLCTSG